MARSFPTRVICERSVNEEEGCREAEIESADVGAVSVRRMDASDEREEDDQGRLDCA